MFNQEETAEDYIKDVLDIPAKYKVESIIGIGYPDEKKPAHSIESLPFEKLHREFFGRTF
jgi:hypothetical protein